jgi:hypothetical protein
LNNLTESFPGTFLLSLLSTEAMSVDSPDLERATQRSRMVLRENALDHRVRHK